MPQILLGLVDVVLPQAHSRADIAWLQIVASVLETADSDSAREDRPSIERHAYAEAPPRVEYGLTDLGRTLEEPIRMLTAWARENGEAVVTFREAAEAADLTRQ
ncbi:winged helix-turn-helix transcriptional regulator [Streptomyces sp. NPDC127036]|uniref:winged helix-turn-helix transcriptional regulator n=1 Tax=Streptomyces sp. NPDC127036 TaxID=3347112 RepID=UPI00366962E8